MPQALYGTIPSFGQEIAAGMSELRISNTSLRQCDVSHLAVYGGFLEDGIAEYGSSSSIGSDNLTGCLPDFLLFCEDEAVDDSALYCPSVAFRRPIQAATNQLDVVCALLAFPSDLSVWTHVQQALCLLLSVGIGWQWHIGLSFLRWPQAVSAFCR